MKSMTIQEQISGFLTQTQETYKQPTDFLQRTFSRELSISHLHDFNEILVKETWYHMEWISLHSVKSPRGTDKQSTSLFPRNDLFMCKFKKDRRWLTLYNKLRLESENSRYPKTCGDGEYEDSDSL